MKKYYKIMLGSKNIYSKECLEGNFIGIDEKIYQDLTSQLPDNWRDFNRKFIPIWLNNNPGKNKIAAGLACGAIWTITKGMEIEDVFILAIDEDKFRVGEVISGYEYHPNGILPHRRMVKWYSNPLSKSDMSDVLKTTVKRYGTVTDLNRFSEELEKLVKRDISGIISSNPEIEDPYSFAMEKHLEEFLVKNWSQTQLGREYVIFSEEGELVGQQYPSDTGPIDVLAISKDKKTLLVVELKKGRASDNVVGQIQRYMGYVKEELAEEGQIVKGVIIALEDDLRIRRALSVTNNIEFFRYQVSFNLIKR